MGRGKGGGTGSVLGFQLLLVLFLHRPQGPPLHQAPTISINGSSGSLCLSCLCRGCEFPWVYFFSSFCLSCLLSGWLLIWGFPSSGCKTCLWKFSPHADFSQFMSVNAGSRIARFPAKLLHVSCIHVYNSIYCLTVKKIPPLLCFPLCRGS